MIRIEEWSEDGKTLHWHTEGALKDQLVPLLSGHLSEEEFASVIEDATALRRGQMMPSARRKLNEAASIPRGEIIPNAD